MKRITVCPCLVGFLVTAQTWASIVIETVPVGNPGNAGELSGVGAGGYGSDRICGAVGYRYDIGKFEITVGQYTDFLNAVAATDTYGLYSIHMDVGDYYNDGYYGCNIQRSGASGSYTYTVGNGSPADVANWSDRSVNYVSWGNAARFANWMHNCQPIGPQSLSTTEDGSYYLNGATSDAALIAVTRKASATWVIPTEDEWYKTAYQKNDGVTGHYWDYPTATNSTPNNDLTEPDQGNSANYGIGAGDYTIGSPYWRTRVGEFENSESAYGTFDQGGNVWEWNEAVFYGFGRGLRGGSFWGYYGVAPLHAAFRIYNYPTIAYGDFGFRVAYVPEPSTLTVLAVIGLAASLTRRRRRSCARPLP